jgi:cyclic pyranopterin phosphate synthase
MVELTRKYPVNVRFIEEMPFNGTGSNHSSLEWDHIKILETIKTYYPSINKIPDPPFSTSLNYRIDGFQGTFGIIAAYSRTFCGSCNRIRITPQGQFKNCLYDDGIFNIRDLVRNGSSDEAISKRILEALSGRQKDGFEAEQSRDLFIPVQESMASIGG